MHYNSGQCKCKMIEIGTDSQCNFFLAAQAPLHLTKHRVRELFNYDEDYGDLIWIKPGSGRVLGEKVGCLGGDGRKHVKVEGRSYRNDALIYLWHHGILGRGLKQIDGNRLNIRIENLTR